MLFSKYSRQLFLFTLLLGCSKLAAQLFLTRQVIGSATISSDPPGTTFLKFTASVGEPISGTVYGDIIATTGFQQPDDDVITSTVEIDDQTLSIDYFPNPAKEWLAISLPEGNNLISEVQLFDVLGRQLLSETIDAYQQEVRLEQIDHLAAGTYSLHAIDRYGQAHHLGLVNIVK